MPREHRIDPHLQAVPSSGYSGHFLPLLPVQSQDHKASSDSNKTKRNNSGLSSSFAAMTKSEEGARKLDRKALARRHLTAGLVGGGWGQGQGQGQNRTVRRTQSFNYSQRSSDVQKIPVVLNNTLSHGHISSVENQIRTQGRDRKSLETTNKNAKQVIQQWNELLLEMNHNHHRKIYDNKEHLEVISDSFSDEDSLPPTRHGTKPMYNQPHISSQTLTSDKTPTATHVGQFPSGVGFTRYRPITPNFLLCLDKRKLSSKRRTQLWVNQIPQQKRHFYSLERDSELLREEDETSQSPDIHVDVQSGKQSKPQSHGFL